MHKHAWPLEYKLSEVNQTEKDKYHMISFTCGIQTTKQTHQYREQMGVIIRGEGVGWIKWVKGINSMVTNGT